MKRETLIAAVLAGFVCTTWPQTACSDWLDFWLTPDQQGQRLYENGDYAGAAEKFTTPDRMGVALYRAGDFEQAAAVLGRATTAEAAYNRGNAQIMLGQYSDAIQSFERALQQQPGWSEAEQNLSIARLRLEALAPPDDDYGGTGGQVEPDKEIYDPDATNRKSSSEEVAQDANQPVSDQAMRAAWLRRVDTSPGDFLAAKFAYQLATQQREADDPGGEQAEDKP